MDPRARRAQRPTLSVAVTARYRCSYSRCKLSLYMHNAWNCSRLSYWMCSCKAQASSERKQDSNTLCSVRIGLLSPPTTRWTETCRHSNQTVRQATQTSQRKPHQPETVQNANLNKAQANHATNVFAQASNASHNTTTSGSDPSLPTTTR